MRTPTYCYWSVGDGEYADMLRSTVRSARAVGVDTDFHIWADRAIDGAVVHPLTSFGNRWGCLFKFDFLRDRVRALDYDYFIWLDADTYFVRNPGDVLRVMHGSPVHATLECDAVSRRNTRSDWWDCPLLMYVWLMQMKGVRSRSIFNVNGGFFIVHREAIDTFCRLAVEFLEFCRAYGYVFVDEVPLAYVTHMLCADPFPHTLSATSDLWASDWTGCYQDRLPDGQPWTTTNYFTGEPMTVNPAIVHAMRSKAAMVASPIGR